MYIDNYIRPISKRSLHYGEGRTLGLVVKDASEYDSDNELGVYIPKLMFGLPISSGAYEKSVSIKTSKILNSKNKTIGSTSLKLKNYVNLQVAQIPNIRTPRFAKGENVFIDNADRDIKNMFVLPYSLGEVCKRKHDKWSIMVPDFKSYAEYSDLDYDNSYGMQLDSEAKSFMVWLCNHDGEKSTYMMAIDAKKGSVVISDNAKRTIEINTDEDRITIQNEAKSKIEMAKDTINISAKTINITADSDINVKSKNLSRKVDNIKSEGSKDEEKYDTLSLKGNDYKIDYSNMKENCTSFENKSSKWKVDSPISGFTKTLTCNDFSIWSQAGITPLPTCANISSAGIAAFGNPSVASLALAKAQPVITCLTQIAATVDVIGSVIGIPPTLAATVAASTGLIQSLNAKG